ncbi:MAG: glycosyltransferase family 2 protein [Chitinophagales bacterium]|nr:glycosyltransferase family 2 protein [Chitinophagales bacterium]
MKVCGFSFIRNAVLFDYPIQEAMLSILPLCDEFFIAVGQSDDETLALIKSIDSDKIRIIETIWDDSLREGGQVLAVETNKSFQAIPDDYDWCIYIQGDEVIHEKYHENIKNAMERYCHESQIDGLLFDYLHFYGSYDYVATSAKWYKHEIRIIKNNKNIYSYRDAQGFRKDDDKKLNVAYIDASVYHYGWVKPPKNMQAKQKTFHKLWHDDQWVDKHVSDGTEFDYSGIDQLAHFEGTHPMVMADRIERLNWHFHRDLSHNSVSFKDKMKQFLKKYLGLDFSYRNYVIKDTFR